MQLRKDYFLNRWVIISTGRNNRPNEFKQKNEVTETGTCFFCPGNEDKTPPEIGRIEKSGKWVIRWFPNKFPAVEKGTHGVSSRGEFLTWGNAYGQHEIIIDTPDHDRQLYDLTQAEVKELLGVYANRIFWLSKDPLVGYVMVFKNHGKNAGTSIVHSHNQVISLEDVPSAVLQEAKASKANGKCPYCSIAKTEAKSERRCFENGGFVAFTPYASRFNYEIWIMPKKHTRNLLDLNDEENEQLAEIFCKVLRKVKGLNADYNFFIHYSPSEEDLHLHIEVTPRIALWGGFELSSGIIINSVSPEDAAAFYRG